MNLTQVVWYSLAIGLIIFITLFTVAYISYKVKNNRLRLRGVRQSIDVNKTVITRNGNLRVIPEKVAYVKKHSQIKETLSYSARMAEEKRYWEERRRQTSFKSFATKGRFTVVNDIPKFTNENYQYVPSQVRRDVIR